MIAEYQVSKEPIQKEHPFFTISGEESNSGVYEIVLSNRMVGTVDICYKMGQTYCSVQLIDAFLTIEQMMNLMERLRREFGLLDDQKVSFEQL